MIGRELLRRSQELAAAREPFVTATVVRAQHPTSVQAGSVGLVLADGTIEGFVGGTCAEQSVKAYSLVALQSGEPTLLRILPDPDAAEAPDESELDSDEVAALSRELPGDEQGAVTVQNPCLSGGAIEIFLEPSPPAPRVLVVGETPVAEVLARIGLELGLATVVTDGHDPEPAPGDLALVVAAHGRDEQHALRRALEAEVPYVGLVASERRGAGVLDELRSAGVGEEQLARIEVPAGVPIGSHSPGEIAVSILARIVSVRGDAGAGPATPASLAVAREAAEAALAAGPGPGPADAGAAPASAPARLAVDPICGMTVAAVESTLSLEHDGETVYFCGEGCKAAFEAREGHASVAR